MLKMQGCGACAEYEPRFRQIASAYQHCLPVLILDANDPQHAPIADKYRVVATPTTLVLRRSGGQARWEGAISDAEIHYIFQVALRGMSCEL